MTRIDAAATTSITNNVVRRNTGRRPSLEPESPWLQVTTRDRFGSLLRGNLRRRRQHLRRGGFVERLQVRPERSWAGVHHRQPQILGKILREDVLVVRLRRSERVDRESVFRRLRFS